MTSAPSEKSCPTACPASHPHTLGQRDKTPDPGTTRGTTRGTGSLKALADNVLGRNKLGQRERRGAGQASNSCPTATNPVGQELFENTPSNKGFREERELVPHFFYGGLGQRDKEKNGGRVVPPAGDLPDQCPLRTGGPVPAECRFHPKLFKRLLAEGALPMPDGSCPLRAVCKLEVEK